MVAVTALSSFEHGGKRKRDDVFEVSDTHAKALKRAGLVSFDEAQGDPIDAAGAKSSASPVAQVSPQTTAKRSGSGAKRKKAVLSSS